MIKKVSKETLEKQLADAQEWLQFLEGRRRDFAATYRALDILEGQCRDRIDDPKWGAADDEGRADLHRLLGAVEVLTAERDLVEYFVSEPDHDVESEREIVERLKAQLVA